jgi:hypothetical protein
MPPLGLRAAGRAVITLATTRSVFVDLAVALARSVLFWNGSGLSFHLVTDLDIDLPRDLRQVNVTRVSPGALGTGFSPKLRLDEIAPAKQTLFLDADCLCFGPLGDVFDRFAGRAVSVAGTTRTDGHWWCDVAAVRARLGLGPMPFFNGGLYYVEPGAEAAAVYARARALEAQYDDLGLMRLRGRPNDEILMSIAMAERGLMPVEDDGSLLGLLDDDVVDLERMDVLSGVCRLVPRDGRPAVAPRVVHFLDYISEQWPYRAEAMKLALAAHGLPAPLARAGAMAAVSAPGRAADAAKRVVRPAYRTLFGSRPVELTDKNR